ncbi:MAG: DnaB-like helicase N-terminal domain-containing protein [Dehalococcoidia bacterium]|nr:DnaB-like helicase N-terminal domain-containing protein [Dehalococcoidia bacterium]
MARESPASLPAMQYSQEREASGGVCANYGMALLMDLGELASRLEHVTYPKPDRITFVCPLCNVEGASARVAAGRVQFYCPNHCDRAAFEKIASNGKLTPAEQVSGAPGEIVQPAPKRPPQAAPVSRASVPARVGRSDVMRRVPPQDLVAEEAVLGAIFLEPSAIEEALAVLTTDDFYREAHRTLFRTMLRLWRKQVGIDAVTVMHELRTDGKVEEVGGAAYIAELAMRVPTAANIKHYAGIVHGMAVKRQIASAATELASLAYDAVSWEALIGEAGRRLLPILTLPDAATLLATRTPDQRPSLLSFAASREQAEATAARPHIIQNLLTVEDISGLAAKKGTGKSTFLRHLAVCVSHGTEFLGLQCNKTKVWYLDLEPGSHEERHKAFERLGWSEDDDSDGNLVLTAGCPVAGKPWAFQWLEEEIKARGVGLVIIDTYFKFCMIPQANDYSSSLYGTTPLEEVVKRTGAHVMVSHHSPKNANPKGNAADLFLGSVGIAGSFGVCLALRKLEGAVSLFMDPPRYTKQVIEGEWVLRRDEITGGVELGGKWNAFLLDVLKAEVLEILGRADGPMSIAALKSETSRSKSYTSWACKSLYDEGKATRFKVGRAYQYEVKSAQGSMLTPDGS